MDFDDESPFYLELEVDDEISFKQPSKTQHIKSDTNENTPPNDVNLQVAKSSGTTDSFPFKIDGSISFIQQKDLVPNPSKESITISQNIATSNGNIDIDTLETGCGALDPDIISATKKSIIPIESTEKSIEVDDEISIPTNFTGVSSRMKTSQVDPISCSSESYVDSSTPGKYSHCVFSDIASVETHNARPNISIFLKDSFVNVDSATIEVNERDDSSTKSIILTKEKDGHLQICAQEIMAGITDQSSEVGSGEFSALAQIDSTKKKMRAPPDSEVMSNLCVSIAGVSKLSDGPYAPNLEPGGKLCRVSHHLSTTYDEELHTPKYSQAEMDTALEQAQAAAVALTNESFTRNTSHAAEMQQRIQTLEAELAVAKQTVQEYKDATDLQRAQTRALSHRLQMLESELSTVGQSKSEAIVVLQAKYTNELQEQHRSHANTLAALRKSLQELEAEKVKAVTESYEAQLSQLRQQNVQQLASRESEVESKAKEAIATFKATITAQAKSQFAEGNRKYNELRTLRKELQLERDALAAENVSLKASLQDKEVALQSVSASSSAAEACATESFSFLVSLATSTGAGEEVAALLSTTALPRANFDVTNYRKVGEIAVTRVTSIQSQLTGIQTALKGAQEAKESMQAAVTALEASLRQADASLVATRAECAEFKSRAAVAESLLVTVRLELADTKKDRDDQLNACAKMVTSSALHEELLANAQREAAEAAERAANLRKMNEELLAMLEKMYTGNEQAAGPTASSGK